MTNSISNLSFLNPSLSNANSLQSLNVIQRLISRVDAKQQTALSDSDAVALNLRSGKSNPGRHLGFMQRPELIEPARRNALMAYRAQQSPADLMALAKAEEPVATTPQSSTFAPGKIVVGQWGNGKLSCASAECEGSYEGLPGNAQIKFELDGFTGYVLPNKKCMLFNSETNESYTCKLNIDDQDFCFYDIKAMPEAKLNTDPLPNWEGKIDGSSVMFNNMKFELAGDGTFKVEAYALVNNNSDVDKEKMADSDEVQKSSIKTIKGEGYLDNKGNLVVAFQDGNSYRADYRIEGNHFRIYDYQFLG